MEVEVGRQECTVDPDMNEAAPRIVPLRSLVCFSIWERPWDPTPAEQEVVIDWELGVWVGVPTHSSSRGKLSSSISLLGGF